MTSQELLMEIFSYRDQIERCPDCEGVSVEFVFNVLDHTAPENFTARCMSCGYTMHDDDPKQLLAKWNAESERARRIDYANDER